MIQIEVTWLPNAYRQYGKRVVDIVVASTVLICLSPIMIAIGLAIRIRLGSPVLFKQTRPGRHGAPFRIVKFRTMLDLRDADQRLLPDRERITRFGRFLRRSSLDELPELFNVFRGDMSLVGPRPLLMRYLPYFTAAEQTRFDVVPGVTGWAQVNGRNNLSWDDRFRHDVWYVENLSLWLDMKILALTVIRVVQRHNVRAVPALSLQDLDEARGGTRKAEG